MSSNCYQQGTCTCKGCKGKNRDPSSFCQQCNKGCTPITDSQDCQCDPQPTGLEQCTNDKDCILGICNKGQCEKPSTLTVDGIATPGANGEIYCESGIYRQSLNRCYQQLQIGYCGNDNNDCNCGFGKVVQQGSNFSCKCEGNSFQAGDPTKTEGGNQCICDKDNQKWDSGSGMCVPLASCVDSGICDNDPLSSGCNSATGKCECKMGATIVKGQCQCKSEYNKVDDPQGGQMCEMKTCVEDPKICGPSSQCKGGVCICDETNPGVKLIDGKCECDDGYLNKNGTCQKIEKKDKIIAGYVCGDAHLPSAEQMVKDGFNQVSASFYDATVVNGKFVITKNKCCPGTSTQLSKDLLNLGVDLLISFGGDGCQGAPPDVSGISEEAILKGFEEFREQTGIDWSGVDFDWEGSGESSMKDMNKIGKALRNKGYIVTTAPMSSQFQPGGKGGGWQTLDPIAIDYVMPQWYQGGCVGTQSCPCWGTQPINTETCPGWKQDYAQQSRLCGINQWIQGYEKVGQETWNTEEQFILGVKSWCGGDNPVPCSASDTGIFGYQQMQNIVENTKIKGVYMWNINDYYNPEFYTTAGNPINSKCSWTNHVAKSLGIQADEPDPSSEIDKCKIYAGSLPVNCSPVSGDLNE